MPGTYVDVGAMAVVKDAKKVAMKYASGAQKLMRDAATSAIRADASFTPDKSGSPKGFAVDATLTEVTFGTLQGQPAVTCKMNGTVATYPQNKLLTAGLNGSATIGGGTSDRDVNDCIKEAMKATMTKSVLPFLRKQPKP